MNKLTTIHFDFRSADTTTKSRPNNQETREESEKHK